MLSTQIQADLAHAKMVPRSIQYVMFGGPLIDRLAAAVRDLSERLEQAQTNIRHNDMLGFKDRYEKAEARVKELEKEVADWKEGSAAEAREADAGRKRIKELEARINDAMDAGYAQGVEATEARAIKRIAALESKVKAAREILIGTRVSSSHALTDQEIEKALALLDQEAKP